MCFGYDGEGALRDSLEKKGASRRSLFRGAAAGVAGAAAFGALGAATPAVARGGRHGGPGGHGHGRGIQHDRISIQMYTLRAATNAETLPTILHRLAQYGYEKVELAGYYGRTARELRTALDAEGIQASSSHEGISADATAARTKFENARILGQRYVVVPYLNSDPNQSQAQQLAQWQTWADQMNAEAALARRYGLRYGYHNHAHEFTIDLGGGLTPWEVLTDRLDRRLVHLEADLYWVYTGGVNSGAADPLRFTLDVIGSAPQEVRQYHVKDRAGEGYPDSPAGDMADLGTGVIDFPTIFRKHQVEEYIVENDTPDVTPLTTAAVGHAYLDHVRF